MGKAIVLSDVDFSSANLGQVTLTGTDLIALILSGSNVVRLGSTYTYSVTYVPQDIPSSKKGVTWSVTDIDGNELDFASIDSEGILSLEDSTSVTEQDIIVKAVSQYNPSIEGRMTLHVTQRSVCTITPTAVTDRVSVSLSPVPSSNLDISFTVDGATKHISISSGQSSGSVSIEPSAQSRTITLSVSPASDQQYYYNFSSNTLVIPATSPVSGYTMLKYITGTLYSYASVPFGNMDGHKILYKVRYKRNQYTSGSGNNYLFGIRGVLQDARILAAIAEPSSANFPKSTWSQAYEWILSSLTSPNYNDVLEFSLRYENGNYIYTDELGAETIIDEPGDFELHENRPNIFILAATGDSWDDYAAVNIASDMCSIQSLECYYMDGSTKVTVCDLRAAKRNSDNAIGLLDTANSVFYASETTTPFTAGPAL